MSTAEPPTPGQGVGPGPDGETIVDPSYYELLGIPGNADEAAIKKAYRKMAIKWHPDKNVGNDLAAAKFQEISEAYAILSNPNDRATYNKQGKKSAMMAAGEEAMPDPGQMFSQMFGGKAFEDWVGEISLGKDVSKAFEMSTTEEEREEMKQDLKASPPSPASTPSTAPVAPQSTIHHQSFEDHTAASTTKPDPFSDPQTYTSPNSTGKTTATTSTTLGSASGTIPSSTSHNTATSSVEAIEEKAALQAAKEKKRRLEAEQREKMETYEKERSEEKKERIRTLVIKLKERIRPFVEANKPGDNGDPETQRYLTRIKEETMDLALESFGVELCHLIGEIYMQKASLYLKLHKKSLFNNVLGVQGWWSRVKEKGQMVKEGWSFLSVGLEVQRTMADMEKRQEKGELGEDEAKEIEMNLSGTLLLVAWKGSKFELSTVLRQVVDGALTKESPEITDEILMKRAHAIMFTGAILKTVTPEEGDDERRELERMVAEASRKRKEAKTKPAKGKGTTGGKNAVGGGASGSGTETSSPK